MDFFIGQKIDGDMEEAGKEGLISSWDFLL